MANHNPNPNHNQERILRPIYNFLDTYNYSKALKLTYAKPQNVWPITVALRAHCLERCGKKLEACRELRVLLGALSLSGGGGGGGGGNGGNGGNGGSGGSGGKEWSEIDEMIWLLGLGEQSKSSSVDESTESSASSSKGKGKKGKSKSSSSSSPPSPSTATSSTPTKAKAPLDIIHVLDLPKYQRQEILSSTKYIAIATAGAGTGAGSHPVFKPMDAADEVRVRIFVCSCPCIFINLCTNVYVYM